MSDCLFCKIAAKEIPATVVYKDDDVVAFEDVSPQAPVHIVVIPKKHMASTNDIAENGDRIAGKLLRVASEIAKDKKISDSGYRLIVNCGKDAGQVVPHVHIHLLGGRKFGWPPG